MTIESLTQYVFEDKYPQSACLFSRWLKSSERFSKFVGNDRNKNKFRSKVKNAMTDGDFKDVWFEFYMAYLLLQDVCFSEVVYEKYETKNRAPDFTVTYRTESTFNIEIRRIRKSSQTERFESFKASLAKQIPSIQTKLAIDIYIQYMDEFNPSPSLLRHLENNISEIIAFLVNIIPEAEESISTDEVKRYSVPGFDGEVELAFSKPVNKKTTKLSYYDISSHPPFRSCKEHYKFSDILFDKLGQMRSGEINIIAVITDNDTHNEFDFGKAIESINDLIGLVHLGTKGSLVV